VRHRDTFSLLEINLELPAIVHASALKPQQAA
jgi:hypothetical protein